MNFNDRWHRVPPLPGQHSILAQIAYAFAAIVLLVLGFFFVTVALVAGAIAALVILTRLWWISRRIHCPNTATDLEGEFTVVERRALNGRGHDAASDPRP
jgi:hypothetical protein